jgi:hypothetical protein
MRWLGIALFLAGIGIAGVYASRPVTLETEDGQPADPGARIGAWWDLAGLEFTLGAVFMLAGGLLVRRERGPTAGPGGGQAEDGEAVPDLVRTIRDRLDGLPEDLAAESAAAKEALDEILEELVPRVLDRREALVQQMGLGAFAEMIGHFAQLERNAARAWSCLIDEAYEEIPECVERAREGANRALETLSAG